MAGAQHDNDDEITGINITPLVDVTLVLLIIFMVTATYIVNQSINVNLPKSQTGQEMPAGNNLSFVLDKDSHLFLNGQKLALSEIESVVSREKAKGDRPLAALIAADKGTPHGSVIALIDAVRKAGISDFAINVEAGSEAPPQ
jgi:biopolymer transport protein ExbD